MRTKAIKGDCSLGGCQPPAAYRASGKKGHSRIIISQMVVYQYQLGFGLEPHLQRSIETVLLFSTTNFLPTIKLEETTFFAIIMKSNNYVLSVEGTRPCSPFGRGICID